jgi:two-component system cell cycle sensor histidine kinase/response regulator CckA
MLQQIRLLWRLMSLEDGRMKEVANRYLEAVGQISEGLYARTDAKDAIRFTISTALQLVDAEAGAVFLANTDNQQLVCFDAVGTAMSTLVGSSIPLHHGLAGAVFSSGKSEIITDVNGDSRDRSTADVMTGDITRQMIIVPLKRWNGEPLGILQVLNRKEHAFSKEDADILIIVSALATAVIEQMRTMETLRQSEAQLREAQKMEAIGSLAGGIAHDFNNLVTIILGYSELLLSAPFEEERWRRDLTQIREAGQRAAGLTRQLLAFSRRQVLRPTIVDVNEAILSMAGMLQQLVGEDIEVVTNLDSSSRNVEIDRSQLEQIIMNLAVNARDAMEHGGRLEFQTKNTHVFEVSRLPISPGPYVVVTVSDTGCGMDPLVQSQVFEPFFTTKPQGKGTGLGLSTVYGIIKQSGGAITIRSEVTKGTFFTIYLPASSKSADLTADSSKPRSTASGTILLVEDEPAVRTLVAQLLQRSGYDVIEATHGFEALQKMQTLFDPPDLILTDVVMPQMSGIDLVHQIRQRHANIKVLFMSGYSDHHALKQDVLNGTAFLQKPFTPIGLTDAVRQAIQEDPRNGCVGRT